MVSRSPAFLGADSNLGPGEKVILPEMQGHPRRSGMGEELKAAGLALFGFVHMLSAFCAVDEEDVWKREAFFKLSFVSSHGAQLSERESDTPNLIFVLQGGCCRKSISTLKTEVHWGIPGGEDK